MRKLLVFIFLLPTLFALSQDDARSKLGIKTSVNFSTLTGTELENARPKFGYTAGVYHIIPFKKSDHFLQMEYLGHTMGSNFKNASDEYSKIALFYIGVPVQFGYTLDKDKGQAILAGPYFSYLGLSSMFLGNQRKAYKNNLNLAPWDVGLQFFYQVKGDYMGFQAGVKIALPNINEGVYFQDVFPVTGNGGTIRNLGLEFGFIF